MHVSLCECVCVIMHIFFLFFCSYNRAMNQWSLFIIHNSHIWLLAADMCITADIITRCLVFLFFFPFSLGDRKSSLSSIAGMMEAAWKEPISRHNSKTSASDLY